MKSMLARVILYLFLTGCGTVQSDKIVNCSCCETSFTSIDSAFNCISQSTDTSTKVDNRLFLFAFANKDVKSKQNSGWNIIKDQDIINVAKRNYVLIIVDPKNVTSKKQLSDELLEITESHKDNLFFVITNQELYPFADWTDYSGKCDPPIPVMV